MSDNPSTFDEEHGSLKNLRRTLQTNGERLLTCVLPHRINAYNVFIENRDRILTYCEFASVPLMAPVGYVPDNVDGSAPCNDEIVLLIADARPHLLGLTDDIEGIHTWVRIMLFKILPTEEVARKLLKVSKQELDYMEERLNGFFTRVPRYYSGRTNLLWRLEQFKVPRDDIIRYDRQQYINMWEDLVDMRDKLLKMHRLLMKSMSPFQIQNSYMFSHYWN